MNKYANTILAILITIILVILFVVVNLYIDKYLFKARYIDSNRESEKNLQSSYNDIPNWIEALSSKEKRGFAYPDNELIINMDRTNKNKKLSIYEIDDYKLFCFNQILEQNNLEFSYRKYGNKISLEILNNKSKLSKIIDELNNYNIKYSID